MEGVFDDVAGCAFLGAPTDGEGFDFGFGLGSGEESVAGGIGGGCRTLCGLAVVKFGFGGEW